MGREDGENVRLFCTARHSVSRKMTVCFEFSGPVFILFFRDDVVYVCVCV